MTLERLLHDQSVLIIHRDIYDLRQGIVHAWGLLALAKASIPALRLLALQRDTRALAPILLNNSQALSACMTFMHHGHIDCTSSLGSLKPMEENASSAAQRLRFTLSSPLLQNDPIQKYTCMHIPGQRVLWYALTELHNPYCCAKVRSTSATCFSEGTRENSHAS